MREPKGGFNLLEMLVALAVAGIVGLATLPSLLRASGAIRVTLAANELVGVLHLARSSAIRQGVNVGVKFWVAEEARIRYSLHKDGNGNGVRTADIAAGEDERIGSPRDLVHLGRRVRFGFPEGRPPRDPGDPERRLDRLDDPIRFNRSDIASFSSLGTSTPGSLYLTDGYHLSVVRLFGRTGKIKTLRYDAKEERWE